MRADVFATFSTTTGPGPGRKTRSAGTSSDLDQPSHSEAGPLTDSHEQPTSVNAATNAPASRVQRLVMLHASFVTLVEGPGPSSCLYVKPGHRAYFEHVELLCTK